MGCICAFLFNQPFLQSLESSCVEDLFQIRLRPFADLAAYFHTMEGYIVYVINFIIPTSNNFPCSLYPHNNTKSYFLLSQIISFGIGYTVKQFIICQEQIGAMSKIKISYAYKGDMTILQQETDEAVKKTMQQLEESEAKNPNSNFKQLKPFIQRRLQEFFMNASSQFRNIVQYSKTQEKDYQRIVMEPDQNLQKINQVKTSMLKQSLLKIEREKWPDMKQKINIAQPQTLNVVHFEGFKEDINESLNKNFSKVSDFSEELQRIKDLEDLIVSSVTKIEAQQKQDNEFQNLK